MRRNPNAIDGFAPRKRAGRTIGGEQSPLTAAHPRAQQVDQKLPRPIVTAGDQTPRTTVSRQEIDDSLKDIDDSTRQPKAQKKGLFGRFKKEKKPISKRKKWTKRIIIAIILIILGIGAYVGIQALLASGKIFQGNIFGILQNAPLKEDANGRTNILVFGTSGSVDDQEHEGANLTDTLMVLSINQTKKDAYMVSLPRDFYVEYGAACLEGYQGKINSMYACYSDAQTDEESEAKGAKALQDKIGQITGLELQYYAHINWAVVAGSIDAIGGVDVDVQGDGSCGASGYAVVDYNMKIQYTAGTHHMGGEEALRFSRARGAAGGCGLGDGDFDRQLNQQKVLKAMQKKAVSAETLTNVGKVTGLVDALGQNLRTNFDTSEIRTLMSLGNEIETDKIQTIDLVAEDNRLIVSGNIPGAGSTQVPAAGTYDYSEISAFINKTMNSTEVTKEAANVALFNGSGVAGYAQERADALAEQGFTVTTVDNAPEGTYEKVEIYDVTQSKPATKAKLEKDYGVKAKTTTPPVQVVGDTDIVVIYGEAASAN